MGDNLESYRSPEQHAWHIFAGEQPPEGHLICSGNRTGWIFAGECRGWHSDATIFEFTKDGWLFWAPLSAEKGFLQLVLPRSGKNAVDMCRLALRRSRILKDAVALGECIAGPLPCAAALHSQLTGPDWIATGTSALRYDPVSGDGTGAALRSAILACATLRGAAENSCPQRYLGHYRQRLEVAFRQHLRICESLYNRVGLSDSWNDEIACLRRLGRRNSSSEDNKYRFRLWNYKLLPA